MRRSAGFTMVELIVVMVLLGIVATVAMPRLMSRRPDEERGVVDQLRIMLRHARKAAMVQNRQTCVIVQTAQRRVIAVYATPGLACDLTQPLNNPADGTPYIDPIPPIGITAGGVTRVRFNVSGQPVNAGNGNAVLAANQSMVIGSQPALVVSQESGFAYSP